MSKLGRIAKVCLMALALLLEVPSCHRIRLYDPEGGVHLELLLHQEFKDFLPCDVNMNNNPLFKEKAFGFTPEMMWVLVYDTETHQQVHEDLLPVSGGFIQLEPGVYDVIVYGMGAEKTRLSATHNRGLGKAYTDTKGSFTPSATIVAGGGKPSGGSYTVIDEPDQLYVGRKAGLEVPVHPPEGGFTRLQVDVFPLVQTYSFTAYNIEGLEHVTSVICHMTGQAPDRFLWDEHFTLQPVVQEFTLTKDPGTYSLKGVFNTFGKIPQFSARAYLQVVVQTKSGKYYRWSYDVTDQFDNPDNTCHSIIVTDPIDIPDDPTQPDNAGFGPGVNPWQPEIYDIYL